MPNVVSHGSYFMHAGDFKIFTNELLMLIVIRFDMPLGIFCTEVHNFLVAKHILTLISVVLIL